MSITSDRIREQGFFHPLADDAADEIEEMEKRIAELERQRGKLLEVLTESRRELHSCQAAIHLCGGFDTRYVTEAQASIKRTDSVIAEVRGEK